MRTLQGTDACVCALIHQYWVWCCVSEADSHEKLMRGRLRCGWGGWRGVRSVLHYLLLSWPLCLCAMLLWLCLLSVACNQLLFLSLRRGLSFVPARAAKTLARTPTENTHRDGQKHHLLINRSHFAIIAWGYINRVVWRFLTTKATLYCTG